MSKRFKSVWDALTDTQEEAASMKARSEMMMVVVQAVQAWNVTQKVAAERLGITQPRVNDLLKGRIARFNMEALFDLATKAGLRPAFTTNSARSRARVHARSESHAHA
jgi:predicted XRE-type DNA-binding protein